MQSKYNTSHEIISLLVTTNVRTSININLKNVNVLMYQWQLSITFLLYMNTSSSSFLKN